METTSDVIDQMTARGFCARSWDHPSTPGAIAIASSFEETEDGIRIYKHMVLVAPADAVWKVSCWVPSVQSEHQSLSEAVEVAAELVLELKAGGIPHNWLGRTKGCT